jgi:hypothetical protein
VKNAMPPTTRQPTRFATEIGQLSNHPLLLTLTAIGGLFSVATTSLTGLGLPGVLYDLGLAALLAVCTIGWAWNSGQYNLRPDPLLIDPKGDPVSSTGKLQLRPTVVAVTVGLMGIFIWRIWAPASQLLTHVSYGAWEVCGVVLAECSTPCLRLKDHVGRPIGECVYALDDAGYIRVSAPSLFAYPPRSITAVCAGRSDVSVNLDATFLDRSCSARKVLR